MKFYWILLLALLFLSTSCSSDKTDVDCLESESGISTGTLAEEDGCSGEEFDIMAVDLSSSSTVPNDSTYTETEQLVQDIISGEGIHVVHFWAPWCAYSINEFRRGWYELIEQNEDVTFTFVTVWNNDQLGEETLEKYAIPERVFTLSQPDFGPSDDRSQRRKSFLDLPVTWIPTTWILHDQGELAFALNYGEMEMDTIQSLINTVRADW